MPGDMARNTLFSLAAGAALLSSSSSVALVRAASLGTGLCVAIDTNSAADNNVFPDNSPEVCADYCVSNGYSVLAVYGQACFCWPATAAPAIQQQYTNADNQDCGQSCAAPYAAEFCGGADPDTFLALYNYFALNGSSSVPTPSAAASTVDPAAGSSSPSSSSSSGGSGGDPAATADSNPAAAAGDPQAPTTLVAVVSPSAPAATTSSVPGPAGGAAAGISCPPPSSLFQSTSYMTATFTCSDGSVDTTVLAAGASAVCYDPALSTTTVVEDPDTTTTVVVLVPVVATVTVNAALVVSPPPVSALFAAYNNGTSVSAQVTAVATSATTVPFQGGAGTIMGTGNEERRITWALVGLVMGFLAFA